MSEDWALARIGDEVTELPKSRIPASDAVDGGRYAFICSSPDARTIDCWLTDKESVVLGTGGVASVHLGIGRFAYSTDTWALRPIGDALEVRYLYRVLGHLLPQIDYAGFEGSGLRHLRKSYVRDLQALMPPVLEQHGIIAILDALDETIRHTKDLVAKLMQIKQGLLHDLFTRGISERGKLRPSSEEASWLYEDSALGQIPIGWKAHSVGELLDLRYLAEIQDGNHGELHPKREDFVPEGVPFVMAKDLAGGYLHLEDCYRITRAQYGSLRVGFAAPGDVLLSHKGSIGETAIVPDDAHELMLTPQVTYYRPGSAGSLIAEFLLWWFRTPQFQSRLAVLATQSTRSYVGITGQRQLLVPVPEVLEQGRIVHSAQTLAERASLASEFEETLCSLRQGLLDDLLSGRVSVNAPMEAMP